jgi:glutathione S-transferase
MKLYDFVGAPNPKKVRVYLAEKGITIPVVPTTPSRSTSSTRIRSWRRA